MKITIQVKLLLGFTAVAIIAGIIGYIGISKLNQLDKADTRMYEKATAPMADVVKMTADFERIRVNYRDAILADKEEVIKAKLNRTMELTKDFANSAKNYSLSFKDETDKNNFESLTAAFDKYTALGNEIDQPAIDNQDAKCIELLNGQMNDANKELQNAIDKLSDYNIATAKTISEENSKTAQASISLMVAFLIFGVLLAIALGLLIAFNIKAIIKKLIAETKLLVDAAVGGKLSQRADISKINFEFQEIPKGVNATLDAVIGPLNVAAEYVDRISKGNIPNKITDSYNGDFNEIKNNLNACIDAVNLLVSDAGMLSKAAVEGKLATRADASKHEGDFGKIVKGVNDTLDAVIRPVKCSC